ncbi:MULTISPECIES: J domain-containing protein [unclassified Iodidimonas]|jgi:hypothetical protein|uniref:J domain-containing protein n=1 Tax=unclassified Iodidimonas TaxID=2626145 RepID=UPI002482DDD3|nr:MULTISPECIES: J domain-containing protein [unclassified Iodidimonas]
MHGLVAAAPINDIGAMTRAERFHGKVEDGILRPCAEAGCDDAGLFRAPRRDGGAGWHWFCLPHIRAFNAAWDYTMGMDQDDIERLRHAAPMWERRTWPMGSRPADHRGADGQPPFHDPHDLFTETQSQRPRSARAAAGAGPDHKGDHNKARAALEILGLDASASRQDIKNRYKDLVRRYHPDSHGGDRRYEPHLNAVIGAYKYLTQDDKAMK